MNVRVSRVWFGSTNNQKLVFIYKGNFNLRNSEFVNIFFFSAFVLWEINNKFFLGVEVLDNLNISSIKFSACNTNFLFNVNWRVVFSSLLFKKVLSFQMFKSAIKILVSFNCRISHRKNFSLLLNRFFS